MIAQTNENELDFEKNLVNYLSGNYEDIQVHENPATYIANKRLWEYKPEIKTTEQLWQNFKQILEQHNQATLDHPLSRNEFAQVKKVISDLKTPYQAGQFLYGLNGVSQIEVDLDDGKHAFLTVFDQKQIGAGDTVYQVVRQIEREPVISGKKKRIFDTTLLINGLPIIQIEEKTDAHDVNEAFNQMEQYIAEAQYTDIFSTLQILVAMTPHDAKYMANTTLDNFNKDFAFNWQRPTKNSEKVRNWKEFCDLFLSIPMAHQMATNYMILDGTKNRQMLKVMRPYQVYATRKVIEGIKHVDFDSKTSKIGYIWHTTGSGKTITSFKTAWLASRLPNVDKVVFLVDRIALTQQTMENYTAYDPDATEGSYGSVLDTSNTYDLSKKLKSKDNNIIVTSVQKLETLIKRNNVKLPDKHIVFIVDEAHRSTSGQAFQKLQKAFPHSAWVGYTGTPMFDEKPTTKDLFGDLLHAYTIKQAIADGNVLGFKVDFETTIDLESMRKNFLPKFYRSEHENWSDEKIQEKINNLTDEDMDDEIQPSFYDNNKEHIELVVKDIFEKWRNRSNDGKYNALLTTHVAGGKSTKMAMMYYDEFQRINAEHRKNGGLVLKVAVTFSQDTSNSDEQLETNSSLSRAIKTYNEQFGTNFDDTTVKEYTQDVVSRLNKTAFDKQYLDLVIVVDQLLTGFDAPGLNTLYVDRTLRNAALIQAYSRTNRIADLQDKPWGRIVNYRWPKQNEKLMNQALSVYADIRSANEQTDLSIPDTGVVAPKFEDLIKDTKKVVNELRTLTQEFTRVPASETMQVEMLKKLREYNSNVTKLKQYTNDESKDGSQEGFDYNDPDALLKKLDITKDQEATLTTSLSNELKRIIAKRRKVPVYQIDLKLTHIKDVEINYDYLTELIIQLMNEVHEGKSDEADQTHKKIIDFASGLENLEYAEQIKTAAKTIVNGDYPTPEDNIQYPVRSINSKDIIDRANKLSQGNIYQGFINKWGLQEAVNVHQMGELLIMHTYGEKDLDNEGQLREIINVAGKTYKDNARDEEIRSLNRIKFRNSVRDAIYELADKLVGGLID